MPPSVAATVTGARAGGHQVAGGRRRNDERRQPRFAELHVTSPGKRLWSSGAGGGCHGSLATEAAAAARQRTRTQPLSIWRGTAAVTAARPPPRRRGHSGGDVQERASIGSPPEEVWVDLFTLCVPSTVCGEGVDCVCHRLPVGSCGFPSPCVRCYLSRVGTIDSPATVKRASAPRTARAPLAVRSMGGSQSRQELERRGRISRPPRPPRRPSPGRDGLKERGAAQQAELEQSQGALADARQQQRRRSRRRRRR